MQKLAQSVPAIHQDKANEQHYEVPTSFLSLCLGPRMKYSSCYYPSGAERAVLDPKRAFDKRAAELIDSGKGKGETLAEAEEAMMRMYTERAGLDVFKAQKGEGLSLLDLGCGWGSLGLYLAEVRVGRGGARGSGLMRAHGRA